MSNHENSSNDILYRALYDGEEYLPWSSLQSSNTRTQRESASLFLNGIPSWGNRPPMQNSQFPGNNLGGSSRNSDGQSPGEFDMWSSRSLKDRNIKLQWEARAEELGISTSSVLAMQEMNKPDTVFSEFHNGEKDAMCYPKWNIEKSTSPQNTHVGNSHPSTQCEQRVNSTSSSSYGNSNLWEYHSLYNNLHDSQQLNNKPHIDSPLSDRVDEFFTTIPEERRFVHVTGSPACNTRTKDNGCAAAHSCDVSIAIETSEEEEEDSSGTIDDEKEEESSVELNNEVTHCSNHNDDLEQAQPTELLTKTQETVDEPEKLIEIPEVINSHAKQTKKRKRVAENHQVGQQMDSLRSGKRKHARTK